jgi:hypothetical protein
VEGIHSGVNVKWTEESCYNHNDQTLSILWGHYSLAWDSRSSFRENVKACRLANWMRKTEGEASEMGAQARIQSACKRR